jgi:hypothetical protein
MLLVLLARSVAPVGAVRQADESERYSRARLDSSVGER